MVIQGKYWIIQVLEFKDTSTNNVHVRPERSSDEKWMQFRAIDSTAHCTRGFMTFSCSSKPVCILCSQPWRWRATLSCLRFSPASRTPGPCSWRPRGAAAAACSDPPAPQPVNTDTPPLSNVNNTTTPPVSTTQYGEDFVSTPIKSLHTCR